MPRPWLNAFRHHGLYRLSAVGAARSRFVLNAFRHHGLYRAARARSCGSCRPRAQRLSASRIISATHMRRSVKPDRSLCAQRLSASRIIIGLAGDRPRSRPDVLNAFRHHGLYRMVRRTDVHGPSHGVLNAFRHHGLYRRRHPIAAGHPHDVVLNAFRHHGLYRPRPRQQLRALPRLCSTPFGITDYIGAAHAAEEAGRVTCAQRLSASRIISAPAPPSRTSTRGAQRLSASRIISVSEYPATGEALALLECSTPFGITDYIGPAPGRHRRQVADVLNAFRHHGLYRLREQHGRIWLGSIRCSTPFGITDYIGLPGAPRAARWGTCAQRLSASRIISVRQRIRRRWWIRGAQRLSASRIISAGAPRRRPSRRSPGVLNAFRHHGLYRTPKVAMIASQSGVCSTPFGITDYIGWAIASAQAMGALMCSTPFGITDYIGSLLAVLVHRAMHCAQRLSASRIISGVERAGLHAAIGLQVLNAFRHHGLYRTPESPRSTPPICAQRLSASRIISAACIRR